MADPTVDRLGRILHELKEHKSRLEAKAKSLREQAELLPVESPSAVALPLVADSISEQVDTGLDFLVEIVETIIADIAGDGAAAAAGDDGDEEAMEVGIEPEDAEVILTALQGYRGMLSAYIGEVRGHAGAEPSAIADLEGRKKQCEEAIELTEGLVLEVDEEAAEAD